MFHGRLRTTKWFGGDITFKADAFVIDGGSVGFLLGQIGLGQSLPERIWLGVAFLGDGRRVLVSFLENHYLAADALAARLGVGDDGRASLKQTFERWDGKYASIGLKGEIHLADVVEVFHRRGGVPTAVEARECSGGEFDPALVDLFYDQAPTLCAGLDAATHWETAIAPEPSLASLMSQQQFDDALGACADFID